MKRWAQKPVRIFLKVWFSKKTDDCPVSCRECFFPQQVHTGAWKPFARCQWAKRVRTSSLYQLQTDVYIPWHVIVVELTATGMKPLAHAQVKDPTVFAHDKVVLSQAVLLTNTGPGTIGVTPLPSNPPPSDPLPPDPSTSVGGATGVEAHSSTSLHTGA